MQREQLDFAAAATDYIGWLLLRSVGDAVACSAAGVSRNFLSKRHKWTGQSRKQVLADALSFPEGKVAPRARGSRAGMPNPLADPDGWTAVREADCCTRSCGLYVTEPCYAYHWANFAAAKTDEGQNHAVARVLWNTVEGGLAELCPGRLGIWFGIGSRRVRAIVAELTLKLGGQLDFSHGMTSHRTEHPPANALGPEVEGARAPVAAFAPPTTARAPF
mgnify:FL=1